MMEGLREHEAAETLHVGIVYGPEHINFVAAAETGAALMHRLAEYVRRKADVQLYPDDSDRLGRLLERGECAAAVRLYFERAGERWDREWLEEVIVPIAGAGLVPGAVAPEASRR